MSKVKCGRSKCHNCGSSGVCDLLVKKAAHNGECPFFLTTAEFIARANRADRLRTKHIMEQRRAS